MTLARFFICVVALAALMTRVVTGSSLRRTETEENMSIVRRMEPQELMETMLPILYCYPEEGFDFVGYDIGNAVASLPSQCCYFCNAFSSCKAYSWSNYNGGTCWFKSQRGPVIYKAGVQSALLFYSEQQTCTIQAKTDYVDNDLARVDSPTAGGCCDKCKAYPGCRAFSYTNYLGGSCWLKSAKGTPVANNDVQSAEVYPSPSTDTPTCNDLQYGIDLFDNDIGSAVSSEPWACCDICKQRSGCRAFSWSNMNGGTCWLKSRTGNQVANPSVISATVFANPPTNVGVDYFDHDIGNRPSAEVEGCCDICKAMQGCKAFSWTILNGGTCWLKSAKDAVVSNSNVKSGTI